MRVAECIKYSETLTSLPDDNRRMDRIGWMRPSFFLPASSPLFRIQISPNVGIHNGASATSHGSSHGTYNVPFIPRKDQSHLTGITREPEPTLICTKSSCGIRYLIHTLCFISRAFKMRSTLRFCVECGPFISSSNLSLSL